MSIELLCLAVEQPIGEYYIGKMRASDLQKICYFEVRHKFGDDYLGIQRELSQKRVDEIARYSTGSDATFPTSIVLAIDENCAEITELESGITRVKLHEFEGSRELDLEAVPLQRVAKVIDGQHRIAGLAASDVDMDLSVALFIGADLSDQANVFSTVNLAQTKVNRSLAYDLFELARVRSPQKSCHNVVVALDREKDGPLSQRIKRLGTATPGRAKETITQATLVNALLPFLTRDADADRKLYRKNEKPPNPTKSELMAMPFRQLFLDARDIEIAIILRNYFKAVEARWPVAWRELKPGAILNRTNGVRALMQVLKVVYPRLAVEVPDTELFVKLFENVPASEDYFNKEEFLPGTGGEAKLKKYFLEHIRI